VSLGHSGSFTASKSREFWCDTHGARCTRSINGDLEYGHLVGCPSRPESFSKGTLTVHAGTNPTTSRCTTTATATAVVNAYGDLYGGSVAGRGEPAEPLATSPGFAGERCLECAKQESDGEPIEV
jgi:hypothetical protein